MDIGQQFGGYRIEGQVGRGGMGVVHEAYDTVRERRVALKVLAPDLADDEGYRARFLHEARTVAGLTSPHVVPVHDFGVVDGRLFLDMALIDGLDLAAVLAAGPVSAARAVGIVEQVADALDVAHERGLVHRDVKAANVLVVRRRADQPDFVYLSDFGLARSTAPSAAAAGLTAVGTVVGTAECMSPEQIEGRPVDARSDVYALGCLLFHCLTGRPPFTTTADGRPASAISVLDAHRAAPVPLLPPGGAWGSLDLVLATAMAKDPAHRYASAGALGRAAREALSVAPAAAPAAAAAAPVLAHAAAGGQTAPTAPTARGLDSAETMAAPARTAPPTTASSTTAPAGGGGGVLGALFGGRVPPRAAPAAAASSVPPVPVAPLAPTGRPPVPGHGAGGYAGQPAPPRRGLGTGAVIGIVGGSLAVLGLIAAGGVIAVGAFSEDEPAAAASTPRPSASAPASSSSSAPSSTSPSTSPSAATPAPPATVPNPALGATTTQQMDAAHTALLAALPRELNACEPITLDPGDSPIPTAAAVSCLGTNLPGGEVYAMSYPDEATRDTAFNDLVHMEGNTNGQCPNNDGAGPWTSPSGASGGTAACYQVFDDPEDPDSTSHAVMAWTVAGQPIFLTAFDPWSSLVPPLVQWQQGHAAEYAATIPDPALASAPATAPTSAGQV